MKQYCRYCNEAHEIDDGICYCNIKKVTLNKNQSCRLNNCKDFEFNEHDVFDIDKIYKPKEKVESEYEQLQLK